MAERNAVAARDPLLTRQEAADFLGVKAQTLALWASSKRYDLRFFKIGVKTVRYRLSDLESFVASRAVEPAAPVGGR